MKKLILIGVLLTISTANADDTVRFNRDIRPILSENCYFCHGPDSARRKADLRLDTEAGLLGMGEAGPIVVKGQPDKSELIKRALTANVTEMMPPPKSNKKLTLAQKELLRKWIQQGAEYENHWSFVTPVRAALPKVQNQAWVKNPIDAFILARLEALKLQPAPQADRRALLRRLSLDLIGLPPTPEEVEAFVLDPSPNAYEKQVNRLLASEKWGEHRGRYWLDAARYGDTHGLHFDNLREMWPYRDWVIKAFNRNLPFDQFTLEQIAGDLLPNRTADQQIASGFHRCNITTNEGGSIAEEVLVHYTQDRVATTSTVWLGLTAACAECHNHKFDPISQKEFYQLAAFFRNTTQGAMDGNIPDTPPIIVVPSMEDRPRWDELQQRAAVLKETLPKRRAEARKAFDAWRVTDEAARLTEPLDPTAEALAVTVQDGEEPLKITAFQKPLEAPKLEDVAWNAGPTAETKAVSFDGPRGLEVPGVGNIDADKPFSFTAWVYVPTAEGNYTIASKLAASAKDPGPGWKLALNNRVLSVTFSGTKPKDTLVRNSGPVRLEGGKWAHLCVVYDGRRHANGILLYVNGKLVENARSVTLTRLESNITNEAPLQLGFGLKGGALAEVRFFDRVINSEEVGILHNWLGLRRAIAKDVNKLPANLLDSLGLLYFNRFDAAYRKGVEENAAVDEEIKDIRRRSPVTHVMQERAGTMPTAKVLFRGQYDQPREEVKPGTFSVLPPMPKDAPANRLGLAQWLIAPENPLTARVAVNRFWQEVFGTGIVRTAEDFGSTGEPPSHPELLDWLAVEFRESGWDVKKLFKTIVMSNTYQQVALVTPEKREKDPQNRFLSRGPRYRMDGEMIRDYALAASGLLVHKLGGPSVKPYQPEGVWEAVGILGASNSRDYKQDKGDGLYRRSMYWFWKRMAPPASLDIFNAPSRETCTVRRERTNTPLQALVTMNDPQYIEAARHLAQLALKKEGDTATRLDFVALRLMARPFRAEEQKVVQASLAEFLDFYRASPKEAAKLIQVGESRADPGMDAPTLAAWTLATNQLMNLDEVLNK